MTLAAFRCRRNLFRELIGDTLRIRQFWSRSLFRTLSFFFLSLTRAQRSGEVMRNLQTSIVNCVQGISRGNFQVEFARMVLRLEVMCLRSWRRLKTLLQRDSHQLWLVGNRWSVMQPVAIPAPRGRAASGLRLECRAYAGRRSMRIVVN